MNKDLLNSLVISDNTYLSLSAFITSIILSFFLSLLLSKIYRRYSNGFSNPESLARILPILSIGTTIIIAVVKSSLALSLGLVGALSIVRFRTPIKEPEELTYIFLTIGIGLATGASQYSIAIIGVALTGWLVDATGDYGSAFFLCASVKIFGAVVWFIWSTAEKIID